MMKHLLLFTLLALLAPAMSEARVLQVGPTRQYTAPSKVMGIVQDGDTVEIDAGLYSGDVGTWNKNHLVLRGVGGIAHLEAAGKIAASKGIWVIDGNFTTVENIEFSGATFPTDKNGAGIRMEGSSITIRHCYFINNDDGILTNPDPTSDVVILNSEFAHNGYGDGYSHNMYIGHNRSFTLEFCYSHNAKVGHCVKTRASTNYILYNRIMDSTDGTSSYLIDMPNGGRSFVIGNLLQKGPLSQGSALLEFGAEGLSNPDSELYVVNNTWVNQKPSAQFYHVYAGTKIAYLRNNLFAGPGMPAADTLAVVSNVKVSSANDAGFTKPSGFDYHLTSGAHAIDSGIAVGDANGTSLVAALEYVHPLSSKLRETTGAAVDAGAFEFETGNSVLTSVPTRRFDLYPNPATSRMTLDLGSETTNGWQYKVLDILGREMMATAAAIRASGHTLQIPLGLLPNGSYEVVLERGNEVRTSKFMIAR